MDIEHIREFVRAVEKGSFTKAAIACNTTQPAVSRHIADLEKELGAQLFERGPQTEPTPEGRLFYDSALTILRDYDSATLRVKAFHHSPLMHLTIALFKGYKQTDDLVSTLRIRSMQSMRRLVIQTVDIEDESPFDQLKAGTVDLAFVPIPADTDMTGLAKEPLFEDELVAIVESGHPLASVAASAPDGKIRMADIGSSVVWTFDDADHGGFFKGIEKTLVCNGATPSFVDRPWSNTQHLYENLPFLTGGIHINLMNAIQYSMPTLPEDHLMLRFSDDDTHFSIYMVWLEKSSNPAVPMAVDLLKKEIASRKAKDSSAHRDGSICYKPNI